MLSAFLLKNKGCITREPNSHELGVLVLSLKHSILGVIYNVVEICCRSQTLILNHIFAVMFVRIVRLVKYEAMLEFRNKALIGSLLVYVLSTVFVCYQSFHSITNASVWNALFWIVVLFASTNAVLRTFYRENQGTALYLYQTVKPGEVIVAKIVFNYILTLGLVMCTVPVFWVLLGNPVQDTGMFFLVAFLAAGAFSACLTLVSAMAGKTSNSAGLTPILAFPVILPVLIVAIKGAEHAASGTQVAEYWDLPVVLAAFNVVIVVLSFFLFPYLWRD